MLSSDSQAIFLLCAWLPDNKQNSARIKPLTAWEWHELAVKIYNSEIKSPGNLFGLSSEQLVSLLNLDQITAQRIVDLLGRAGQAVFEYERMHNQGYDILTRADAHYPIVLKNTLRDSAPPLFWTLGKLGNFDAPVHSLITTKTVDLGMVETYLNSLSTKIIVALSFHGDNDIDLLGICNKLGVEVLGVVPCGGLYYTREKHFRDSIASGQLNILSQSYPGSIGYRKSLGFMQKQVEVVLADKVVLFNEEGDKIDEISEKVISLYAKNKVIFFENIVNDPKIEYVESKTSDQVIGEHRPIYTIGHSNLNSEDFISLLKANTIEILVDIRSVPNSKYLPRFNRGALSAQLQNESIEYIFMGDKLGGRPDDPSLFNLKGKLIQENIEKKEFYIDGIHKLKELSNKKNIVIMCTEEDPRNCHRGYIVSHTLIENNITVRHIRAGNKVEIGKHISKPEIDQLELNFGEME